MLFNSYAFLLVFLPAALLIDWFADKVPPWRTWALILLSLVFYGYWDIRFIPLLLGSIVFNWCAARAYAATGKPVIVTAAIVLDLAVLALFKYVNFFSDSLQALLGVPLVHVQWALPLGISFFTIHHIMYLVDLRRGLAPQYPLDRYALYICFFPQVLSGPLVRWYEVMHQFGRSAFASGWERRFSLGLTFIIIGLMQKVFLGDALAAIVNPLYERAATDAITQAEAWVAVLSFTFQIFFDFAGYSDIAIGLALLFGIELPRNFDGPYRAASVRDFWRRWHMTLSRFLRDYLYIPLGGNRHGLPRQLAALLVTMVLGGLWHGAGLPFAVWGLLHGLALGAEVIWRRLAPSPPMLVSWLATFAFVTMAWVFFRAPSFEVALRMFESLAFGGPGPPASGWRTVSIAAFCAIALPPSHRICSFLTERPRPATAVALALAGIAVLVALGSDASYEFIYFRF